MLSIVACTDSRGGIGNKGHLLFDIKEDKHNFAMLTRGHTVLMGRATYDSLPNGALPHRRNIVISRTIKVCPTLRCIILSAKPSRHVLTTAR